MKQLSWEEFYDRFWDWADSTRLNYFRKVENMGPEAEVYEVIESFFEESDTRKAVRIANERGVSFLPEHVGELVLYLDKELLTIVAKNAIGTYTEEELGMLYLSIDNDELRELCKKSHLNFWEDDISIEPAAIETKKERKKRQRDEFWTGVALVEMVEEWSKRKK